MSSPFQAELERVGALVTDSHIVYTSGRHGSAYFNKDAIYPHTALISKICETMVSPFASEGVEAVLAPAIGGVILCQWMASHLSRLSGKEVLAVYSEPTPDKNFVIKRGYDALIQNKKVLVAEDVLTTGGSVRKVVEVARAIPCTIVGVSALANRGGVTAQMLGAVPRLTSVFDLNLESWDAASCPLCAKNVPINPKLGKGRPLNA